MPVIAASDSASASKAPNTVSLSSCRSFEYVSGSPFTITARRWQAPSRSPARPRTSSAASGLRFCGMIELPVDQASGRLMNPKDWLAKKIGRAHVGTPDTNALLVGSHQIIKKQKQQ